MQDAVQALYMAFAILIFIIALTVGITSFTNQKQMVEERVITDQSIDLAKDSSGKFINYMDSSKNGNRDVKADTIINSIRRMLDEKYEICIDTTELELSSLGFNDSDTVTYTINGEEKKFYRFTNSNQGYQKLINNVQQRLSQKAMETLYTKLKDKTYTEYLGIYQENNPNIPIGDISTERIITYVKN